ncbi:RagB/SusD family nutrient uptake outer membrane protein [Sphingobacterium detergens]|uniref:Putative outer membrane starch-binding protein n=1 Tax=Sphingobacterium detergens TaxID=1145106 RepID=A0A420BGL8_SPHD1|nr:RagB/SusD family nutrient uptake outer membrane protein [Sphingobacterium detergens]RKE55840.1 putative outer membrane starch-binding protein [Sphingobacterium detergens]
MKKFIYISLSVVAGLLLSGCAKYLERDNPVATTDDKWWSLESDVRGYLDQIYGGIPGGSLNYSWHSNSWSYLDGLSDNMIFKADFMGDVTNIPLGLGTTSTSIFEQYYTNSYNFIRMASRLLEHYETAYVEDPNIKKRYAAEARALRAWYHLMLFRMYGPIAIVDHSLNADESFVKRNTQEEVISFIVQELLTAEKDLPSKYTENDNYRFNKGTCYSLLSILQLTVGNYKEAARYAKIVIDRKAEFGYDLHKASDPATNSYADLFTYNGVTSPERIIYKKGANTEAFFRNAPRSLGGQAVGSPTASIVNEYETLQGKTIAELGGDSLKIYTNDPNYRQNRDKRLTVSILLPNETFINRKFEPFKNVVGNIDLIGQTQSTQTGFLVKKYVDPSDVSRPYSGALGFFVLRYAEILLTYVEALVEDGQYSNPDVILYLNMIRNRAGMPNVDIQKYNTKEKLRELIRRERRVELAFEGTRLFDIRRWKIAETVLNGSVYGAVNPATLKPYVVQTRIFHPKRDYLWPIPLRETNANPNMEQNPEWN